MKRTILVLIIFFNLTISIRADNFADGYSFDGYVYCASDGYWYRGGYPYTRSPYTYWERGCQYTWYKYQPVVANYSNYRTIFAQISAQRSRDEGRIRISANEHNQFIQAAKELNIAIPWGALTPSLAPGYGYGHYNPVAAAQLGHYGASGNSLYGYSYSSVADVYGNTDANLLYQQAAALAKNSQDLGGQATSNFSSLVEQAGNNRARVAEILAKGQTASVALQASNAQSSASVKVQVQGTGTQTGTQLPQQVSGLDIMRAKCAACHTTSIAHEKGGDFALFADDGKVLPLAPEYLNRIGRRITLGQMPPREAGGPLPPDHQKAVLDWLRAINIRAPI